MANRPPRGRCVHCLKNPVPRTWDHVFPRAWYPDSTSLELSKWQIPACERCNNEYGKLEEDMLIRLGLCIEPFIAATAGIVPKVLRAIDPAYGTNARDIRIREGKRRKVLRSVIYGAAIPTSGIYPGLGERWDRPVEDRKALTIPANSFRRLTAKIVRGIFYLDGKRFIEPPFVISHFAFDDVGATPFVEVLDRFGTDFAHEPGILVRRAAAIENQTSSIFLIEIWKSFRLFALVDDPNRERDSR